MAKLGYTQNNQKVSYDEMDYGDEFNDDEEKKYKQEMFGEDDDGEEEEDGEFE